jgi:[ribosomal protein S18]-alanine N-acetyltransferase
VSAQWRDDEPASATSLRSMTTAHLDAVMAIEVAAYPFPWSRGNFIDSIVAGYPARVLLDERGTMLGYFIGMAGVDEMHLLNITVAPGVQGRGHARHMMASLVTLCRECAARELWLEVRDSNARARAIYTRM